MDSKTYIGVLCKTPCAYSFWPTLLEAHCSGLEGWNEVALPLSRYPENALGLITYFFIISEVFYNLPKNLEGNQYPNWGIL
jgi:hypothetical protein